MGALSGFGAALRSLRGTRTLEEVALPASVTVSNLSKYELERSWPSRDVLERVLDGLGVSFIDLAVETDRQARIARGEEPALPQVSPTADQDFEDRVRQIVRQEFRSGLSEIAGLQSADIQRLADFVRRSGREPDLDSVALLASILDPKRGTG